MQPTDDSTLLRQYAKNRSEEAFAALVTRHVNLVYSVALRHVGDPHHAEEIAQAVFIILAKKAAQLRHDRALSSWLFQATRLTANNFVRSETRRHRRDLEAHMQSILNESGDEVWPGIAPWLDTAVANLREKDRRAIVLRFYEGRNLREVGLALGASEDAAEKRVNRALEKLRTFFTKRGVSSTTAILAGAISANSIQVAPTALAKSVTVVALAKGAVAGGSALTLAKATLVAMKTKTIVTTIAAAALIAGTGVYLLAQAKTHPPAAPAEMIPLKFANDEFTSNLHVLGRLITDDRFLIAVDPNTRRTPGSAPAGHIKSLVELDQLLVLAGYHDYLGINKSTNAPVWASGLASYPVARNSSLLGKRIRISGWMKAGNVRNWAGAALAVLNDQGHLFAFGDSTSQPIHGTVDWQPIEFVTDIPNESCVIYFSPTLYGNGEIWYDDFQIDIVSPHTPITDDRAWRFLGSTPTDYSETTDDSQTHDGHPALCIAYLPVGKAPPGTRMWWGHCLRTPDCDKYRGHTVRMTVWARSEKVSDLVVPGLYPEDVNGRAIAQQRQDNHPIRGTTGWTQHTVICRIPKETQYIDTGFSFTGSGKVWIDMDSLKYEIVN
jgi:RNA polymerase sigma factor (sigma-70 family)